MAEDNALFDRMFNHPSGIPGRIGAALMARMNATVAVDVVDLLEIGPADAVLEIGFGPGIAVETAAEVATEGYVAGIDSSEMMVERAIRRNEAAIDAGRVELRRGSVEDLPFHSETFDAAFSINSLHAWPDSRVGLGEMYRVLRPAATVAIVRTKHAGRPDDPLEYLLRTAGFEHVQQVAHIGSECVLGRKSTPT